MQHIDLSQFRPSAEWVARARAATAELRMCQSHEERMDYITRHAPIWRDLRDQLIATFGPKCWFTDAPELVARLDVEHFRPKAKAVNLDGSEREGYWWLAFNVDNLRLCGQIPNREHKKCYFPLHAQSRVADPQNVSYVDEIPLFLDPVNIYDVSLVVYAEDGAVHPRADASAWDKERVEITDRLLGLSKYPPLLEARQKVWQQCSRLMQSYMDIAADEAGSAVPSAILRERKKGIQDRLKQMTHPAEPFASVAWNCLMMSGHDWARLIACQQHGFTAGRNEN